MPYFTNRKVAHSRTRYMLYREQKPYFTVRKVAQTYFTVRKVAQAVYFSVCKVQRTAQHYGTVVVSRYSS